MRRMTTVELCSKEIVNLCDGAKLGCATEIEFDPACAQVIALLVPKATGLFCFGKTEYLSIPWRSIECFGDDTILVRLSPEELCSGICSYPPKKDGEKCK